MTVTRNCRYCGVYVDGKPWDHECSAFRQEPPLDDVRVPMNADEYRNTADGLKRYRRGIRP